MTENVHDVAALILERLGPMDTWRLQKLVYYSQAWHLAKHSDPLFDAEIQAWSKGPVTKALYDRHAGAFGVHSWPSGDSRRLGTRARQIVAWVIEQYGDLSGEELSRLTHAEAPWRLTRGGLPERARSSDPIDWTLIRDYYARQLLNPDDAFADAIAGARLEGHMFDTGTISLLRQVADGARPAEDAVAEVLARYQREHR
ncbi:type II toxin-antitoxin system antitoxin SocA domain-containing protein [Frankia sp. Cppng1_Ct_nod]|uniref:type II toxin-antitoxin system antitoxin SocA domain-containing protein n=1 Tax=Frankia sp. Cppng1_Ct_nod TaxID=2897162 RepID=UPI001041A16D|nr:type II toxin-antitoxin system antitoxin SocA domain-containing protein [Frankia sp. Cppng1_Ct_nod]